MLSEDEKRRDMRLSFNQLVRVESYEGDVLQLIGTNYSDSGMALNSPRPLPLGDFVDLSFKINGQSEEEFKITAEVVQSRRHSNMYISGLKFLGATWIVIRR